MKIFFHTLILGTALLLAACAQDMGPDTRETSFAASDKNQDGRLTYGEYQDYLDSEAGMGNAQAQKDGSYNQPNRPKAILLEFQKLDANRDTFVTRDELGISS